MSGELRVLAVGLAVLVFGLSAGPAAAEPRKLVIGVEDQDYMPAYGWQEGDYRGAAREIFDAFAADRGYRLEFRPLPIKRLYAQLVHREIDLKFPDNPVWAPDLREGYNFAYSRPVIRYTDGVMVPAAKPSPRLEDVKTLGTVAGFTPMGWQERIGTGATVIKETARADLAILQVLRGHTDGAYVSVAVANHILDGEGKPGALVLAAGLPHANGGYALSSVSHPEVIAEFNDWLSANTARVEAIKERTGAERGVEK